MKPQSRCRKLRLKKSEKIWQNAEKSPIFYLSTILYRYIETISKAPIRYDTDITDIGDISQYFRYIDPPLFWLATGTELTDWRTDKRSVMRNAACCKAGRIITYLAATDFHVLSKNHSRLLDNCDDSTNQGCVVHTSRLCHCSLLHTNKTWTHPLITSPDDLLPYVHQHHHHLLILILVLLLIMMMMTTTRTMVVVAAVVVVVIKRSTTVVSPPVSSTCKQSATLRIIIIIIIIISTFINSARVTQCHNGAGWRQRLSSAHQICL